MVGVGRDLCGSSSPTLLLKQGHLEQAAQDLVQVSLEYLQRRRLHNLPGQPVPSMNQESCASSRGFSFKSGLLEYTVSMVSKQSCTDGSEIDPLRKEAGFIILATTILIYADSIRIAWHHGHQDGESQ